jgi:signal transduction histidine kinase
MRFRTKTILGVALIELALLAVLVDSALSILRDSNAAELTRRVQLGGKLLVVAAKDAVISQDLATLDSLVNEAMASGQIDFVRIIDTGAVVLAQAGKPELLSSPFHQEESVDEAINGIFEWSAPILAGGILQGSVQLGVSTDPLHTLLASARHWAAGIAGLEMLLVAVFSWLLGSYLAHQLVALRDASAHIAAGDFEYRVAVKGNDELAETALAFNHMVQQLGESNQRVHAESLRRLAALQDAKLAQASAEDRTEQLDAIFTLSPDGFISFDQERRVKYASPAFFRLTHATAANVIGRDESDFSKWLADVCTPEARFCGVEELRTMQKVGIGGTAATRRTAPHLIELAGPGKRVLEVGIRLARAATVSQILYFRDITHETEVDRLKSEFLSTAAHELRTPMASIYGFTELLLNQDFDTADQRDFLAIIFKQSELMISIINELLDLARIEARRGKDFVLENIDLHALLHEIVAGFKTPLERPAPLLPPPNGPHWVRADRKKLTQAVSNVLSNAYKYSPDGGTVNIAFDLAAGESIEPGEKSPSLIGIRISDHGIGMTPEQLARVCERFYRADTSGKIPGTGLGMSIVKEIVELHGGVLDLDSQIGTGSSVTLWLPAANDEKTA